MFKKWGVATERDRSANPVSGRFATGRFAG